MRPGLEGGDLVPSPASDAKLAARVFRRTALAIGATSRVTRRSMLRMYSDHWSSVSGARGRRKAGPHAALRGNSQRASEPNCERGERVRVAVQRHSGEALQEFAEHHLRLAAGHRVGALLHVLVLAAVRA